MPPTVVDDQVIDVPIKVTVGFERSIKVRDYETAKCSVFIQGDVPLDATQDQIEAAARDAAFQAKSIVFDELGIEFSVDDNSVVREAIERQLGPTQQVATVPRSRGGGGRGARRSAEAPTSADTVPAEPATPAPTSNDKPIVRDEACPKCGHADRKFWDNRQDKAEGKVKANYPDWKCAEKSCRAGVWLTPKGSN